jgi:hypothetical protein
VAALVLAGVLWRQVRDNARLERESAALGAADAKAEAALSARVAAHEQAGDAAKRAGGRTPPGRQQPAPPRVDGNKLHALLMADPEYAALERKANRRSVLQPYRAALSQMALSPEMLQKLKEAIEGQAEVGFAATQEKIKALIGDEGYRQLVELQRAAMYANNAGFGISQAMSAEGCPMTSGQMLALARLQAGMPTDRAANDPDPETGLSPGQIQLLDKAAQFLSPPQVAILKKDALASSAQVLAMHRAITEIRAAAGVGAGDSGSITIKNDGGGATVMLFGPGR